MTSFQIQDSVAFVTGTNKANGIGRAIVHALLAQGARKVYATARIAEQLADLVEAYPEGTIVPVALDVTDLTAIEQLADRYPDVNLIVNNAGYLGGGAMDDIQVAQLEIAVNYIAPMAIVRSFAPVLLLNNSNKKNENNSSSNSSKNDNKSTAVVNVNSIASLINFPVAATYSASKAATHSLTQAQRRELPNTLVVGVYPGPIDTDMAEKIDMDKVSASVVADRVVEALLHGTEDVFPDPMSEQLIEGWKMDAKAVERQMAQPPAAATAETVEA